LTTATTKNTNEQSPNQKRFDRDRNILLPPFENQEPLPALIFHVSGKKAAGVLAHLFGELMITGIHRSSKQIASGASVTKPLSASSFYLLVNIRT
jgi:hypothetical protein